MNAGPAFIHLVSPAAITREAAFSCLTAGEKSQAERFRFEKDANHWAACRASLRRILGEAVQVPPGEVHLVFSKFGKPSLAAPYASLHFNLSHCQDLALIVRCTDGPVGIDLEPMTRAPELIECESTFCHPLEILELPSQIEDRGRQLLRIWTAKEAILKAMGTGLSHAPESTRILFQQPHAVAICDEGFPGHGKQCLHELIHPALSSHQAFVSLPESINRIEFL